MSANPSGSLPDEPSGVHSPGGVEGGTDSPSGNGYRSRVVGRIASSIRSARSESELIPVAPERRRLRSLMSVWVAVLPLVVVVFEVIRRILAHYYSMKDVEGWIQKALSSGQGQCGYLDPLVYFLPAAALGISLIITLGTEAAARVYRSPQVRFIGYGAALGSAALAIPLTAWVGFWTYGADLKLFAEMVLICFYIVPLAHLAYLVVSILSNARRSLLDYAVGILVFATAVFVALSMLIGTDALADAKKIREAVDANALGSADPHRKDECGEAAEPSDSVNSGSSEENYWVVALFLAVVLAGAGVTMWNYHTLLRSRGLGARYARHISALAVSAVPTGRGLGDDARTRLCKKIGQQLGTRVSGSPAGEYAVYICSAGSPLGLRLPEAVAGQGHDVAGEGRQISDPAISAGVKGVFTWVSEDEREWNTASHQYLYIKVSEGIAGQIYDCAVKSGRRWPFVIDADVLACCRLLSATVADSVYRSGVHRLMPKLDDERSPKRGVEKRLLGGLGTFTWPLRFVHMRRQQG